MTNQKQKMQSLLWVMLLDKISVNITIPVLTFVFFSTDSLLFHSDVSHATRSYWYGICLSLPNLVGFFSIPILSVLSDALGRKSILIITAVAAFIFALFCSFGILLGSLAMVLLGKFIGGFFSRTDAVAQAAAADYSTADNKLTNMARLQVVISLGAAIGPIIGGYTARGPWFGILNYAVPYILAALVAIATVIFITLFFSDETRQEISVQNSFRDWLPLLLDKKIQKISLLLAFVQISWGSYYQFMAPILKQHFGFNESAVGWFIGLIAVWLAVASAFVVPFLKRRLSHTKTIHFCCYGLLFGLILTFLASFMVGTLAANTLLWLGAILVAACDVIIYAIIVTLYSNVVRKDQQGAVMGICFIVFSATWSLTALLGGWLGGFHIMLPLWAGSLGILFAILLGRSIRSVHDLT